MVQPDAGTLLDQLLGPRLGYVMPSWPQAAKRELDRLAAESRVAPAMLAATLQRAPNDPRWDALIHLATVGHTVFYRHAEQLERLFTELQDRDDRGPIRIWCVGCATGEEAYSLALCAQRAGTSVRIVATDVDKRAVEFARRGVYPPHRAHGLPVEVPPGEGWRVPEALKIRVRFEHASLTGSPPHPERFHYIFCRNVMVYFGSNGPAQLGRLARRLLPHGRLVVAPTEALGELPDALGREQPLGWLQPLLTVQRTRQAATTAPIPPPVASVRSPRGSRDSAPRQLRERAALSSAAGKLEKAEHILRQALETDPQDAVGWFLLGEVLVQRGEASQAAVAFEQARRLPVPLDDAHVDQDTLHQAARRRRDSLNLEPVKRVNGARREGGE